VITPAHMAVTGHRLADITNDPVANRPTEATAPPLRGISAGAVLNFVSAVCQLAPSQANLAAII
jgi:hypothetical protein